MCWLGKARTASNVWGYFRVCNESLVKVKTLSFMKKINCWRLLFAAFSLGMLVLESCAMFKPKCDCPHW